MNFKIFRNFRAIRFIRCETPIPGSLYTAGGAALSLSTAIARCESEVVERTFELHELRSHGIVPVGIAAHFNFQKAQERALQESIETLCLEEIYAEKKMRCVFKLVFEKFAFGAAATSYGYFCFIRGFLNDQPIAAYSAASTFLATILKAWEEYQSILFFRPQGVPLKNFTKAHKIFTEDELKNLLFESGKKSIYRQDISELSLGSARRSGRTIVYYTKKKDKL